MHRSGITPNPRAPMAVQPRAVLVFADTRSRERSRRHFPLAAARLLDGAAVAADCRGFADIHLFSPVRSHGGPGEGFHLQTGRTFGERFENAVATLVALGYEEIVAVGRDCPALRAADIVAAFAELQSHALVLGPDHRGGCYLIGLRSRALALLRGIHWQRNTDCAQLRARCGETAAFLLPVKHDLDSWADLRLMARSEDAAGRLARSIVGTALAAGRNFVPFVDLAAQFVRVLGQMPPPRRFA